VDVLGPDENNVISVSVALINFLYTRFQWLLRAVLLIGSVSLSPLYLILLLIHHPRTNSYYGLCALCAETDTKTGQTAKPTPK
jgi:hypothetical protein